MSILKKKKKDKSATKEEVAEFFAAETVETVVPADTFSGYAEGSYPEAQKRGEQFDKPGPQSPVSTGPQEESKLSKAVEVAFGPDDRVGSDVEAQESLAREQDASNVQNVKLGNSAKNPETA